MIDYENLFQLAPSPAALSALQGDYVFDPNPIPKDAWQRVQQGWKNDWDESQALWKQSQQEGFFPGIFHKLGAVLTPLDMLRRAAWRGASGITDPLLRAVGIEYPEDLTSGFEVGNKLAEKYTPDVAPLPGDASFLEGLAKEAEYRIKGLPAIAAQTAGNVFDIYTDPLSMLSIKKPTLRAKVEAEVTKPFTTPSSSIASLTEERNPTLFKQFSEITPENIPEVSARYMQTRIEDKIEELLNARKEIELVPDIARKRELSAFIDNQVSKLQEAGQAFSSPTYAQQLEKYRGKNLPDLHGEGLTQLLNPLSHRANRAYPQIDNLNIADPSIPPELQKTLPYDFEFLKPEILAERQIRLENALRSQKEGLKLTPPFVGEEQFNIPIVTDLTGMIGRGVGKMAGGVKDLIHRAFYNAPRVKDLNILDQQVPPDIAQAINKILPQTIGKEIKARDVEGILSYISQAPGGVRNYAQARDLASRLVGTNQGNDRLTELKPLYEYLGTLGELSPLKKENITNISEAFKKAQDDVANARAADIFQKSYKELEAENITFDDLQNVNKRRIYQWMLRQFKQNPNNPALLNELNAYVGAANVQRIARAKQRYDVMSSIDWQDNENLDKALSPGIDRLATMQTLNDMFGAQAKKIKSQQQIFQGNSLLDTAQGAITQQLDNASLMEVLPKAIEEIGLQTKFAPAPWFTATDDNTMLRGLLGELDDLHYSSQEYLNDATSWYQKTDANTLINFLYSSPSRVQSAISDAVQLWHAQRVQNPQLGASLTDPTIVADLLADKLKLDVNNPAIQQFSKLFSQATIGAQGEWMQLLGRLEENLAVTKNQHHSFMNGFIPMRAMAAEKEAVVRPIYEQLVFGSVPYFKAAREMLYNPSPNNIPAKAAIWQSFLKLKNDLTRGIWRDYGMEPEAVDMTKAAVRNIDYWNQRVADMAETEIIDNLYRPLLAEANIPFDRKKIDQIDQGVVFRYGYHKNLDRIQQGTDLLIDAFNGDAARAEIAYQRWVKFHEGQMNRYQMLDNQAGIPTQYRQRYLPHMLKTGSVADFKRIQDALPTFLAQKRGRIPTQTPGFVGADYAHAHQRDFESLDDYEEFLNSLNSQQSGNSYNIITRSQLQPETSYIRLYAQRLRNHHVAANSLQYLREMELNFPHLIRSMRDVDKDLDTLLSDPAAQMLQQAGDSEYKISSTTPAQSLIGGPKRWSLRQDYSDYLQSYIPYSGSNIEPANIAERAAKGLDLFNYKLQNLNTAFNGPGHVARILANALVGNINFRLALDNIVKYGPNPRLNPLYDDAARAGVFPWAGIDHNKNIREVVDIRMGRPDTGTLDNPIKYSSTSPGVDVKLGKWNVFRTPDVGIDRILGFTAKMREPELSRYITWEFMDKNLRLSMYEQALEMGMNKVQAADFVRNALIDYQMSWHNARLKMWANAIFPFYSWWIGNLRLHLPNMLQEPRMYVIANHVANLANWYATNNYREDNPDGFQSAIALPIQNGPEMIYFQLGLPWETVQNKIVKQIYDVWMDPTSVEDPEELLSRMWNTITSLGAYVNSRATTIPLQLFKYFVNMARPGSDYVAPQLRNQEDLYRYLMSWIGELFWGIAPTVAPVGDYILGTYPGRNLPVTLTRSALGMLGPTPRISQTGERLDY